MSELAVPLAAGVDARAPVSALAVEVHSADECLDALAPEWDRLFAASGCGLPFRTRAWSAAWWRWFSESGLAVRDSLRVHVVRAEGEVVAIAPMMRTDRPGRGPLRARTMEFLGADPNLTEIRGMLARPGWEGPATSAVLDHLLRGSDCDWVRWSGAMVGRGDAAALEHRGAAVLREVPDLVLAVPASWEELRAGLKRNIRESLRKCYNSLSREGLHAELEAASGGAALPALETFFTLHAARAGAGAAVRHPDYFARGRARAFLREVVSALPGAARVFVLRVGGTPVAARVGFRFGDALYLYYSGFDPAFARFSVMTTAVAEILKWAMGEGVARVNLSTGNDVSKTRWGPEEVVYREAVLVAPRLRARAAHRAFKWVRRLEKSRLFHAVRRAR